MNDQTDYRLWPLFRRQIMAIRKFEKTLEELFNEKEEEAFEAMKAALRKDIKFILNSPMEGIEQCGIKELLYLAAMIQKYKVLRPHPFVNALATEYERIEIKGGTKKTK